MPVREFSQSTGRRRQCLCRWLCFVVLATWVHLAGAANPLGIAFANTTNVAEYAQPSGMIIAGRCNHNDPAFAQARVRGAEVLAYICPTQRPDTRVCALDNQFYMNDLRRVPLWPYPTEGARTAYPRTRMTDMRPGSPWILHVVDYVAAMMREGKFDGVFLDVVGARLWDKSAEWNTWPQEEKDLWTDGNVDLVRRLDERRRAIDPNFIIVTNGYWDRGDARGFAGERYVDGIMLEHPKEGSHWHVVQAGKPYGDLGHRRVLVVAANQEAARMWSQVEGVTNVSDQSGKGEYEHPTPPPISFKAMTDRNKEPARKAPEK